MKTKTKLLLLLPVLLAGTGRAQTTNPVTASASLNAPAVLPGRGLAQHDFFYAGEAKIERMLIVRHGEIVWDYTHPGRGEISDAVLEPDGNILFAHQFGVTEISADKKVLWNFDAPTNTEIHTAMPFGTNRVWFIQNGAPAKFVVMNKITGSVEREFILPVKNPKSIHGHFRHARMTDAGTLLVAHMDLGKAAEYDLDGKELWSLPVPGIWSATLLKNGNVLVVSNQKFVREVNRAGETVWEWTAADAPEYKFHNLQLAVRLPNGNTIINDWFNQWSAKVDTNNLPVQAIEVTPDKKVVWALRAWTPPADLGPATTIQILDEHSAIAPGVILTPKPAATPRINGPKIFGGRPGSPFLYSIPVTGDRPMAFAAENLPAGLQLDSVTGQITGALEKAGEYSAILRAKNSLGAAEKKFRIVVGEELALTPPLGWNSWNCWAGAVDQDKVMRSARAMVASGLAQHGWSYINIDDTWQGTRGGKFNAIQPNEKFSDLKILCDDLHALGLKAGIYSTPWVRSYGSRVGGSAENPEGAFDSSPTKSPRNKKVLPYAVGKFSFATNDAAQFAAWGFDYLKYDWNPIELPQVVEMAGALRTTGRDIIFSLSNNSRDRLLDRIAPIAPFAQAWRTTGDITDNWKRGATDIGFAQDAWAGFARPGHWNDPDMLVVGWVGWGPKLHQTKLTPDQQYTHISLWCLLSAPLLIGCDMEKLDDFTLNLLSNDEVLEVDQDTLGKQATQIAGDAEEKIYAKPLDDGSWAVGLFNLGKETATVSVNWSDLKISGSQTVRDLWRQKNLGTFAEKFEAPVAPDGVVLVRIAP